jgi:RNA 2',3'-cyclic 3'-phosphodiesterase
MTSDPGGGSADTVLRAFVAVEISEEVRRGLEVVEDALRKAGANVGWVAPENIHLTIVFLGDMFQSAVAAMAERLDAVTAGIAPFQYQVRGTGYFGSSRSPRVIWAGVEGAGSSLALLQEGAAAAAQELEFRREDRPFKPHLTLGRVRSRRRVDELTSALASHKDTGFGLVGVVRLLLMQSELEHQGVRYSVLHASALKGA